MKTKRILKLTAISVIFFTLVYLSCTFLFRDKSEVMCILSFGKYETTQRCKDSLRSPVACADRKGNFYCVGGFYDPNIWGKIKCPDKLYRVGADFGYSDPTEFFVWGEKRISTKKASQEERSWIIKNCTFERIGDWQGVPL